MGTFSLLTNQAVAPFSALIGSRTRNLIGSLMPALSRSPCALLFPLLYPTLVFLPLFSMVSCAMLGLSLLACVFTLCSLWLFRTLLHWAHYPSSPLRGGAVAHSASLPTNDLSAFCVVSSSSPFSWDSPACILGFVHDGASTPPPKPGYAVPMFDVPLQFLLDRLPYRLLRELARNHHVHVGRTHTSLGSLLSILQTHHCNIGCDILTVVHVSLPLPPRRSSVPADILCRYTSPSSLFPASVGAAEFLWPISSSEVSNIVVPGSPLLACPVPLNILLVELVYEDFVSVLPFHGIDIPPMRLRPDQLVRLVIQHCCNGLPCEFLMSTLR